MTQDRSRYFSDRVFGLILEKSRTNNYVFFCYLIWFEKKNNELSLYFQLFNPYTNAKNRAIQNIISRYKVSHFTQIISYNFNVFVPAAVQILCL